MSNIYCIYIKDKNFKIVFFFTQGGQSVIQLVDFYGATFIAFILAIFELCAFSYIYGVNRICEDVKLMLGFYPGWLWRICWKFVTPGFMTIILIYIFVFFELPKDGDYPFPKAAHLAGWCLSSLALLQVPIFAVYKIYTMNEYTLWEVSKNNY